MGAPLADPTPGGRTTCSALLYPVALLACPVGMGLMMWMMMRGQRKNPGADDEQRQVACLRAEVEAADRGRLPADRPVTAAARIGSSRSLGRAPAGPAG